MFPSALRLSSGPDRISSTKVSTLSNLAVSSPRCSFKELNSLYRSLRASDRDPILERRYNIIIYLRKMQPQITSLKIYYKCMKYCTADHRTDLPQSGSTVLWSLTSRSFTSVIMAYFQLPRTKVRLVHPLEFTFTAAGRQSGCLSYRIFLISHTNTFISNLDFCQNVQSSI